MEPKNRSVGLYEKVWVGTDREIHDRFCNICKTVISGGEKFTSVVFKQETFLSAHFECIFKLDENLKIFCKQIAEEENPPPPGGEKE